jgi:hypothetical protein
MLAGRPAARPHCSQQLRVHCCAAHRAWHAAPKRAALRPSAAAVAQVLALVSARVLLPGRRSSPPPPPPSEPLTTVTTDVVRSAWCLLI